MKGIMLPQDEAPYLISGSWGLSLISHIRSLIWNDELMQKGYEKVGVTLGVTNLADAD
jgi:hypothetical protein